MVVENHFFRLVPYLLFLRRGRCGIPKYLEEGALRCTLHSPFLIGVFGISQKCYGARSPRLKLREKNAKLH